VLEQFLHVHFIHDVKAIFSFSHMQDRLSHELVQGHNIVLFFKVCAERFDQVVLEQSTFGNQRVDLSLLNFEADPVDQQGYLDSVELTDDRLAFDILNV
jgi:hypothetical protein